MTITIIGTGFVGVVTSAVFSGFDHTVFGLDVDERKIASLQSGKAPFYEPLLDDMLQKSQKSGKLTFTTSYEKAIPISDIVIIAVGTPSAKDGTADLRFVKAAAESLAPLLKENAIVALKSTVPPGTNQTIKNIIKKHTKVQFHMASLPEFLREGTAVKDTLNPDRVVIGAESDFATQKLLKLHEKLGGSRVLIKPESAQMAKYTANAYLAQRITFINQIANLCEQNGASISQVIEAIGYDKRIGRHYWYPGLGYGGSCFPKDVKELAAYARSVGEGDGLLVKIDELNEKRIYKKLQQFSQMLGGINKKTIALLGLSFKPNTNDLREAPSTFVIPWLREKGAIIKAYDPEAIPEAQKLFPQVFYADDAYQACEHADAIILLTEWPQLTKLDMNKISQITNSNCAFFDTRNQYRKEDAEVNGLTYVAIGNG